ncbi:MAG: hypothetical protein J3K34DRAFT_412517 [Monoraphidium minutum]|nr:MAG: hypothetical protein J3K34DRAFT_412517 [Monoraphidium minutum]
MCVCGKHTHTPAILPQHCSLGTSRPARARPHTCGAARPTLRPRPPSTPEVTSPTSFPTTGMAHPPPPPAYRPSKAGASARTLLSCPAYLYLCVSVEAFALKALHGGKPTKMPVPGPHLPTSPTWGWWHAFKATAKACPHSTAKSRPNGAHPMYCEPALGSIPALGGAAWQVQLTPTHASKAPAGRARRVLYMRRALRKSNTPPSLFTCPAPALLNKSCAACALPRAATVLPIWAGRV